MTEEGGQVVRAARAAVGARFRLHGREPGTGLDCVGLVAWATGLEVPTGYALRGGRPERVIAMLDAAMVPGDGPGAVLLMLTGPGQLHLGVRTEAGFVHADAGLRRVVERPGEPPWPVLGSWVPLPSPFRGEGETRAARRG